MNILGLNITRTKSALSLRPLSGNRQGWYPIVVSEPTTGAWQRNEEVRADTVLRNPTLFACVTLIASDISKMRLRLMQEDDGIWTETERSAFSPVLRKPNRYQARVKFFQWWMTSKLVHGNTYALKQRDDRRVVTALYILDATRVTPLVAPDASVYYELKKDDISGLREDTVIVPASEIIHDVMCPLFHPLVGVSPIFAAAFPELLARNINNNGSNFFANGSRPGGVLMVPGAITQAQADSVKAAWTANQTGDNYGTVAVLPDGMTFQEMSQSATDSQLIEQLRWTDEQIAKCFHMPLFKVGGPMPPYNSVEAVNQLYYSDCLQSLIEQLEEVLDYGLGLAPDKVDGVRLGVEFDRDDLFQMDTATLIKSEKDANGLKTVNESRRRLGLGSIEGGNTVYRQQQDFSIEALNRRDNAEPVPSTLTTQPEEDDGMPPVDMAASFGAALNRKMSEAAFYG